MNRREFLALTTTTAAVLGPVLRVPSAASQLPEPAASKLPRWRGFNLPDKQHAEWQHPYQERDFEWIAEWGFNFVRLPISYRCWSTAENWKEMKESVLAEVDGAIEHGRQHGIHVNLNLHRAPGYCVNPPAEPLDLWKDEPALEASCHQWAQLARRYKGIPNTRLSFDLLNEPPDIAEATYARVVRRLVEAIRGADPRRLIIADGLRYGRKPVHAIADLGVAQSTRGYDPFHLTHWKAGWAKGSDQWPEPRWPHVEGKETWDKDRLRRQGVVPWQELERKGVGVHVGEWGAFSHTPHPVVLAWMRDCLDLWREAGWGWALWNFRGSFGPLDSGRQDVAYEDFRGHKLDRGMLEVLKAG